jgi:hypothetical protein
MPRTTKSAKPAISTKQSKANGVAAGRASSGTSAKPSAPPAKQPEQKRTTGYWIRKIVIEAFPAKLTNEAIDAALVAASITGTKRSTISTAKQDCLNTLKVAQELGCWKPKTVSKSDIEQSSEPAAGS